jgi:pimeloyl-ACP methyl ester carboxylesterase
MGILNFSGKPEISYKSISGDDNKPCLVFLHEGLGCIDMWKRFPERLCAITGCPGLLYDRAGYGKSSRISKKWSVHYMHEYGLDELPRIISLLIPKKPYIVIGHSDGGSIGLIHAAQRPENMVGLITEAAHVFVEPVTVAGIRKATDAYSQGRLDGLKKYHGEKTASVFNAWSDIWLSRGFNFWNIEYLLPSVVCPVLAIQGEDDQYGTQNQIDAIVSKTNGPVEKRMIAGCAHAPHHEKPDEVVGLMKKFINTLNCP